MPKKQKRTHKKKKRGIKKSYAVKGQASHILSSAGLKADKEAAQAINSGQVSEGLLRKAIRLTQRANRAKVTISDLRMAKFKKRAKKAQTGFGKKGKKKGKKGSRKTTTSNSIDGVLKQVSSAESKLAKLSGSVDTKPKTQAQMLKADLAKQMKQYKKDLSIAEANAERAKALEKLDRFRTKYSKLSSVLSGTSTGYTPWARPNTLDVSATPAYPRTLYFQSPGAIPEPTVLKTFSNVRLPGKGKTTVTAKESGTLKANQGGGYVG
jgi:hypothetical protein